MKEAINKIFPLQRFGYPLLLVLVILAALYPLSCFQYIPKWDNINGYLPYRFFISDNVIHGEWPLWNPYQRLGYPGYADLQSGCWYPVVWLLIALNGTYGITSLILELLITFVIAGLGMYKLSHYIHGCRRTAFLCGLAYSLSGCMVGSSQLMVFLIGVAWLPWCLWSLLVFLKEGSRLHGIYCAIFIAMNVSGASPAYTIILAYLLVSVTIYWLWKKRHDRSAMLRVVWWLPVMLLTCVTLLLPYLQSFAEFAPYFNRAGKQVFEDLIMNPFVPADYLSFIFPYAVLAKSTWFAITDLTLRNAYIGLPVFLAFCFALVKNRKGNPWYWPLVAGIVLSLWLAMGNETFLYKLVYHLPGFGLFRHPAFFRTYTELCMVLLGGFALREMLQMGALSRFQKRFVAVLSALVLLCAAAGWYWSGDGAISRNLEEIVRLDEIPQAGFYAMLVTNAVVILLLLLLAVFLRRVLQIPLWIVVVVLSAADLFVQTRLSAPSTLHYNFSYVSVKKYFDDLPDYMNQESALRPMVELDDSKGLKFTDGVWKNLSTFNKSLSYEGENPLRFRTYDEGKRSGALDIVIQNPLFYFPDKIYHKGDSISAGYVWCEKCDGLEFGGEARVKSVWIGYNSFDADVRNGASSDRLLVLNQNYHHQWKASGAAGSMDIIKVNDMVMALKVPAGYDGNIRFTYESPFLKYSALMSLMLYVFLGILSLYIKFVHK